MENGQEVFVQGANAYTDQLKNILDTLTINESPRVINSTKILDIDVVERITANYGREDALLFYERQFQNIIQKIVVDPEIYFLDFKAGEDKRFSSEVISRESVDYLYDQGLLSFEEMTELYLATNDPEVFKGLIERKRILQWSPDELISGMKYLPANQTITLNEALGQEAIVKLKVITWMVNRFQSIEIIYNLRYLGEDLKSIEFYPYGSYVKKILNSSYLEASSPIKALKQIKSDAELLIDFVSYSLNQPKGGPLTEKDAYWTAKTIRNLFMELLGFQKRLINNLQRGSSDLADTFFLIWREWQMTGILHRERIIHELEVLSLFLQNEIIRNSRKLKSSDLSR